MPRTSAIGSRLGTAALALLAMTSGSCSSGPPFLLVDLRTDLVPGVEFVAVETILTPEGSAAGTTLPHDTRSSEDYVSGERVAEFTTAPAGALTLRVRLRLASGALVVERSVAVDLHANLVVTVVVTRGCRGVVCPMSGDAPSATECYAGRCVPNDCFVEHTSSCGPQQCATSTDCAQTSTCARFECVDGACLARTTPGVCTSAEYCSVDGGCQPIPGVCVPHVACDTGNPCELGATDCSTGTSRCVASGPAPAGTACRPVVDVCDLAESCDGTATTCPVDRVASTSRVCRPSMAPCDAPETCDGSMITCPADAAPVSGCTSALRTAGTTTFVVPVACTSLRIRVWGAGGGHGRGNLVGGAGGYAEGVVATTPGEMLTVVVGAPGASASGGTGALGGDPGGGRGGNGSSSQGGGGGGAYSGVFRGAMTQTGALVIAGGGAGSGGGNGAGVSRASGAGGGTSGENGSVGGGTQTAGGTTAGGGTVGAALFGGSGGNQGTGDGGGGGGGGYFGGGGGPGANTDAGGGGGGSGYAIIGATGVLMATGAAALAGNATDPERMGAGDLQTAGAVLLDCP